MNIEQEIRAQIEKNKGLKLAVGEINNHLSILEGLLRNERDDVQKQVDEAYQRGLDDAWEAARKIVCDEKLVWNTLLHIFNRSNFEGIFGDFSASEAIAKLKAYEEKREEDDIKVGDEVKHKSDSVVWKAVCIQIDGDGRHMNLMGHTGAVGYYPVDDFKKTGRHFDIDKILAEMRT